MDFGDGDVAGYPRVLFWFGFLDVGGLGLVGRFLYIMMSEVEGSLLLLSLFVVGYVVVRVSRENLSESFCWVLVRGVWFMTLMRECFVYGTDEVLMRGFIHGWWKSIICLRRMMLFGGH